MFETVLILSRAESRALSSHSEFTHDSKNTPTVGWNQDYYAHLHVGKPTTTSRALRRRNTVAMLVTVLRSTAVVNNDCVTNLVFAPMPKVRGSDIRENIRDDP